MNKLDANRRKQVINCLLESCSIRSTVRMTGVSKKAVMRLLAEAGAVCAKYQDRMLRNLKCRRLQVDELWAFCYCKEKNLTPEISEKNPAAGDVWLWVAIDADTKLVPCWTLGERDSYAANAFISDLASRLRNRVQLTTDGFRPYLEAVEGAFGADIDYSMLVKLYGHDPKEDEKRYSPATCIGTRVVPIMATPIQSTSAPVTQSGRTGQPARTCVVTHACPMASHAKSKTARLRLP